MLRLKIENLSSSPLSQAEFYVQQDGKALYGIKEISSKGLIKYTKLRMLYPLRIEVVDLISHQRYIINRKTSFLKQTYEITSIENSLLMTFEPRKIGWKLLNLIFFLTYDIRNSYGEIIGSALLGNPTIIGRQYGELKDSMENTVSYFDWKNFSFWKGYRECDIFIHREDENWILISIVAATIKGLYLQQR